PTAAPPTAAPPTAAPSTAAPPPPARQQGAASAAGQTRTAQPDPSHRATPAPPPVDRPADDLAQEPAAPPDPATAELSTHSPEEIDALYGSGEEELAEKGVETPGQTRTAQPDPSHRATPAPPPVDRPADDLAQEPGAPPDPATADLSTLSPEEIAALYGGEVVEIEEKVVVTPGSAQTLGEEELE